MQETLVNRENKGDTNTNSFDVSNCNESIFQMLFNEDDLTWQSIIHELVKTEQMNPWDIDISLLSRKYLEMLKKLKALDFRISGKVILAAAILLRIKSQRLVSTELNDLTRMMNPESGDDEDFFEEEESIQDMFSGPLVSQQQEGPSIVPRTPQPRDRKVSVYDLIDALDQALKVKKRRVLRDQAEPITEKPEKKTDITVIIKNIYTRLKTHFTTSKTKSVMFSEIMPQDGSKQDKVLTFIPLLHLENQRKIDMYQEKHLAEIEIMMYEARQELAKQLSKPEKAHPSKYFKTKDNQVLKDIQDLAIYVDSINLKDFKFYVDPKKNDFATWVGDALKDKKLSKQLFSTADYYETMSFILDKL